MPDSNRFLNDRPFDRFGLGGGRYCYGWSEDRLRSGGFDVPDGMERVKEVLNLPFPVLTDPVHVDIPGMIEYQNSAPAHQDAWYLTDYQPDEAGVLERQVQLVRDQFGTVGAPGTASIPALSAERDQLERDIKIAGGRINGVSEKTRDILLAWSLECLIVDESSDIRSGDRSWSSTLYGQLKFIWERWGKGFPFTQEFLRRSLSLFFRDSLDAEFVEGQLRGVLRYTAQRDQINGKAWYIDRRRMAVEAVLKKTRKAQSVAERTADTKKERERKPVDGRVKGLHLAPDMVRRYWEIKALESEISNPEVRARVLVEFDNVVGDRTLQRYVTERDRPNF